MDPTEKNPHRLENFQAWRQAHDLAAYACQLLNRPPLREDLTLRPALGKAVTAVAGQLAASQALPADSPERSAAQREVLTACARLESLLLIAGTTKAVAERDLALLCERLAGVRMLTHGLLRARARDQGTVKPSGSPGLSRRPPASGAGSREAGPWDNRS